TRPDQLDNAQIQAYLVHLIGERKLAWSSCNVAFSAFRCFYGNVLHRDQTKFWLPSRPRTRQLPRLLSEEGVRRIARPLPGRRIKRFTLNALRWPGQTIKNGANIWQQRHVCRKM
ncbi:MAG: phage integrase N-terminal SAM-like domain-containing protein, partial [Nitrospirae bacterium]|nr:phage integrase N-terminal SAM-like domain-containing protein [Nitrospirota bacterium]